MWSVSRIRVGIVPAVRTIAASELTVATNVLHIFLLGH